MSRCTPDLDEINEASNNNHLTFRMLKASLVRSLERLSVTLESSTLNRRDKRKKEIYIFFFLLEVYFREIFPPLTPHKQLFSRKIVFCGVENEVKVAEL